MGGRESPKRAACKVSAHVVFWDMKLLHPRAVIVAATLLGLAMIVPKMATAQGAKRASATAIEMPQTNGPRLTKRVKPYIPPKVRRSSMCCATFTVNTKGRPDNVDMSCTGHLFKDVASIALKRWTYQPATIKGVPVEFDNVQAVFGYKIYARGNKRWTTDKKRYLTGADGELGFNPKRVCPLLGQDYVPKITRRIINSE